MLQTSFPCFSNDVSAQPFVCASIQLVLPIAEFHRYPTNRWLSNYHTCPFTSGDFLGLCCVKRYMLYLYNDGKKPHVCYRPRCRRPGFSLVVGPAYRMYVIQDIPDLCKDVKYNPVSCEDMNRSPAGVWGTSRRCYSLEGRNKRIRGVFKGLDENVKRERKVNKSRCDARVVGSVGAFVVAGKRQPLVIPNQAVVGAAVITSCRQLLSDVPIASTCTNVTPVCRRVYNVICLSFPEYLFLPSTTARTRQQG